MLKEVCLDIFHTQKDKFAKTMQKAMENPTKAVGVTVACMGIGFILTQIADNAANIGGTATLGAVVMGVSISAITSRIL